MTLSTPDAVTPRATPAALSKRTSGAADSYPVRDYIGAMADELARLARFDGDEALAVMLEAAANRAAATSTAS